VDYPIQPIDQGNWPASAGLRRLFSLPSLNSSA